LPISRDRLRSRNGLAICRLLEQEPNHYERAAVRWVGRVLPERPSVRLRHPELVAANLAVAAGALRPPRRHVRC
jgi:hypothetical protein